MTAHERYRALGREDRERQTAYRALFRERLDGNTLTAIREATNKGWALGNDKFKGEIEDLLRRRARPLPRGRSRRRRDLGEEAL